MDLAPAGGNGAGQGEALADGLKVAFEDSGDLVIVFRLDGTVASVNAAADGVGLPSAGAVGVPFQALVGGSAGAALDAWLRSGAPGGPRRFTCDVRLRSGGSSTLELNVSRLGDVCVAVGHDMAERMREAERTRLAEAVFGSAAEGMVLTDANARIVKVNPAFTRITGYAPEQVVGGTPKLIASGVHGREFYERMWGDIVRNGFWEGEIWNRRKDGSVYAEWLTISTLYDKHGRVTNYVGMFSDISALKEAEARLTHLAHHDPLTGLPNRTFAREKIGAVIERCRVSGGRLAVLFVDLDGFKAVNDTLGHQAGDTILVSVADRLRECVGSDVVARLGGDEFLVFVEDPDGSGGAEAVASRILDAMQPPFMLDGNEIVLAATVGIAMFPEDGQTPEVLVRNADTAMYSAKKDGRGRAQFYRAQLTESVGEKLRIGSGLRLALDRNEFVLHYQPLVDGRDGTPVGAEALIRWHKPGSQALTSPARFVPVAEETGTVVRMGSWVLKEACRRAKHWMDQGTPVSVSVNVSPRQVLSGSLLADVQAALEENRLPPEYLELEITEGVMLGNPDLAVKVLNEIAELGVRIALDDFGTGYSSLAYLRRLPVSMVKIDRSFVSGLPNPTDVALLEGIVTMSSSLGKEVLAEGVETEEQRQALLACGIHLMQGYLFGKPSPDYEPGAVPPKDAG